MIVGWIMSIKTSFEMRLEYLRYIVEGPWDTLATIQAIRQMMEIAAEYSVRKVLVDGRLLTGNPSEKDRIDLSKAGAEKYSELVRSGAMGYTTIAFLMPTELMSPIKIGQTVANLQGVPVKTVSTLAEAFQWLGVRPDLE